MFDERWVSAWPVARILNNVLYHSVDVNKFGIPINRIAEQWLGVLGKWLIFFILGFKHTTTSSVTYYCDATMILVVGLVNTLYDGGCTEISNVKQVISKLCIQVLQDDANLYYYWGLASLMMAVSGLLRCVV